MNLLDYQAWAPSGSCSSEENVQRLFCWASSSGSQQLFSTADRVLDILRLLPFDFKPEENHPFDSSLKEFSSNSSRPPPTRKLKVQLGCHALTGSGRESRCCSPDLCPDVCELHVSDLLSVGHMCSWQEVKNMLMLAASTFKGLEDEEVYKESFRRLRQTCRDWTICSPETDSSF